MLYINKGLHNSRPQIIIITKLNLLRPSEQQVSATSSTGADVGFPGGARVLRPVPNPRGVLVSYSLS